MKPVLETGAIRTEREILERHASEIVEESGAGELVELGSGSAGIGDLERL
ncbi:MAG: L-histidine N(alpha)-methyltransferase [Solirubrobacteraceae bacterium]